MGSGVSLSVTLPWSSCPWLAISICVSFELLSSFSTLCPTRVGFGFQATGKRVPPRGICPCVPLSKSVPETADRAGLPRVREVHAGDCVHFIYHWACSALSSTSWSLLMAWACLASASARTSRWVLHLCPVRLFRLAFSRLSPLSGCAPFACPQMYVAERRRGSFVDLVSHT